MVNQDINYQKIKLTTQNYYENNIHVFKLVNDNVKLFDNIKDFFKMEETYLKAPPVHISLLEPWLQELKDEMIIHLPQNGTTTQMKIQEGRIQQFFEAEYVCICSIVIDGLIVGIVSMEDNHTQNEEYIIPISIAIFISDMIKEKEEISNINYFLEYLKIVDIPTGAFNRDYYVKMLMNKEGVVFYDVGVLHMDFNEIRKLNEVRGFDYVDRILKKIAKDLVECFGLCDSHVFRISGDEFLVICLNIKKTRFLKLCKQLYQKAKKDKEFNVSIGTSYKPGVVELFDMVLKAEKDMRSAKAVYYDKKNTVSRRRDLVNNLVDDLRKGCYSVYLQPKLDLYTEDLVGAEALVRKKLNGTLYLPDTFIPCFEAEGVITHLDLYVLEEVVQLIKEKEEKDVQVFTISTNFSRVTLMEKNIVSKMASVCKKYDVDTSKICIEVTESMNTMTMDELIGLSQKIKEAGFKLSLDDYGSHYSNVTILANIDFDEVKLDKSIIQILHKNQKAKSIVSTTINMCKGFRNTQIVAEGIETKETLDILKAFNCDYGQGFYFSEAISMEEFKKKIF